MQYYNRRTARIEEEPESMQGSLHFLYETVLGRICLKCVLARPWVSKAYGVYQKSRLSRKGIRPSESSNVTIPLDDIRLDAQRIQGLRMMEDDE